MQRTQSFLHENLFEIGEYLFELSARNSAATARPNGSAGRALKNERIANA